MNQKKTIHYRTCHLCEAMCGLTIEIENGHIKSVKGDEEDVHSHGYICPKGVAIQDIHNDPDRLKTPIRRTEKGWEKITWEEAFNLVQSKVKSIRQNYGTDAVGVYTGNPTVHNTGTILYLYDFINAIGTKNSFASHSLDQLPQMFMAYEMFGHHALFPVPDLDQTDFFLVLGANPLVSNGSIMSTPNIGSQLKALQNRGGKLVVIDPRKTRTAQMADHHFYIPPGKDVLLLLTFVHLLFAEKAIKSSPALTYCDQLDQLENLVADFTPARVAPEIGFSEAAIRKLVADFVAADRAILYGRLGVSTVEFGGLCHWLINCINILTGNLDKPGGVLFTLPAIGLLEALKKESKQGRWKSRVRQLPESGGSLPTTTLADEILEPGEGQIKAMFTIAGNPILSAPNSNRMENAFASLDFYVAIDIYLNETTRHADLILPPAAALEVIHYDFALGIVAPRNFANFSKAIFPLDADQKFDWQILMALQQKMEQGNQLFLWIKHQVLKFLVPERRIDLGLRLGPYGKWGGRFLKKNGISLSTLKKHPHGLDFGALKPSLPKRLFTKNKRINLVPQSVVPELGKVEKLFQQASIADTELLLIGRRHLRSNNSWMHNYLRLMKNGDQRCTAMLHPLDAGRFGIQAQSWVEVSTEKGKIKLVAEISDQIMPGVICIPHGWGHNKGNTKLSIANLHPGANVNSLLDHTFFEELSGNAVFSGVPVKVAPISPKDHNPNNGLPS